MDESEEMLWEETSSSYRLCGASV